MSNPQFRPGVGTSDVVFQSFKLYIEGVQVPFLSISISSQMNGLPSAMIAVPPNAGIGDICRWYQPKVHVFFEDPLTGEDCVLFSGVIVSNSYNKASTGQKAMMFRCKHRNALMDGMILRFGGFLSEAGNLSKPTDGLTFVPMFNSTQSIQMALRGISNSNQATVVSPSTVKSATYDTSSLPADLANYKDRLAGFSGVLLNFWQQLKAGAYKDPQSYEALLILYKPLLEEGLQFFKRLSGHPYLEKMLDGERINPCPDDSKNPNSKPALIPPSMKLFTKMAVQYELAVSAISTVGQVSQEDTGLWTVFENFFSTIDYQILTLTSPAEAQSGPIDTIVKPELPFYYSPRCNVFYPHMYTDISTDEDDDNLPSRVTLTNYIVAGMDKLGVNYRGPASIREAIARTSGTNNLQGDLESTTSIIGLNIGKYEQGRGVRSQKLVMPSWLSYYVQGQLGSTGGSPTELPPTAEQQAEIDKLSAAWTARYGTAATKLNPWSKDSNIQPHERLLFAAADYHYTQEVVKGRAGTMQGVFNPYAVPGYPMDILAANPTEPSYHAFCAGITHSILPNSVSTSVSFVAAMTYTEMANYYLMFVHPWLQTALNLTGQDADGNYTTSIVMNTEAKETADKFYQDVFAVGSAAPDEIYDFSTGNVLPPKGFVSGKQSVLQGFERNPAESVIGNLIMARRPIETKASVETRFGVKFVDMVQENYNPTIIKYTDQALIDSDLLEPGASIFLDYNDVPKVSS